MEALDAVLKSPEEGKTNNNILRKEPELGTAFDCVGNYWIWKGRGTRVSGGTEWVRQVVSVSD